MKFTLKDYQRDAVEDVLHRLDQAATIARRDGTPTSFALTAATGAGKTVMAAAAIEALFHGHEALELEGDPGAVVIWFSDDPALNDQTRSRLMEASEKLGSADLVAIAAPFSKPRLEPRKVYFLNTQKLSKTSLLTRGHVADPTAEAIPGLASPDLQGWTIWQTIANTIDEPDLTVYLVLDEAHRGFGAGPSRDKKTIVGRLVSGHAGFPPIPIVWGISATIDRFQEVMTAADTARTRRKLDPVTVDPDRVQESGLVKDVVKLDIPAEAGNLDQVLVRRGARRLRESTERWQEYGTKQELPEIPRPLLVLQAPNTPDPEDIGRALDTIVEQFPQLGAESIRHVLGDHTTQRFGSWEVDWIEPQRVEETTKVRVLIAKDAISTGWDCPRAEVLVSFRRAAENPTHITQLLGRMVRNPLARRVPGDERLNSVDCILPFFDQTTAVNVVRYITGQIDEMPSGPKQKVLLDGHEMAPNPKVPETVWDCWDDLPTLTKPERHARPVKRLVALAKQLSADGLRPGAVRETHDEMNAVLDGYATRYARQLLDAEVEVWAVRGRTVAGKLGGTKLSYADFVEQADDRAIRVAFESARKAFGPDVATSYVNHVAGTDDEDEDMRDAYVRAAALATVPEVRTKVDAEADELVQRWFAEHRVAIRGLGDLAQEEYETIRAQATSPQVGVLRRPRARLEDYKVEDSSGQVALAPLLSKHLMSDADGYFPITALNDWERDVVTREVSRRECVGWYRNPPRAAFDSLGITYRDGVGNWRSMHPDFLFFDEVRGEVRASIVDPHGHHLDDALVKLVGLAHFARDFGDRFHRIEAVSRIGTTLKVLDLQLPMVRDALIAGKDSPVEYYKSGLAIVYTGA